jgi:hypothetical protein
MADFNQIQISASSRGIVDHFFCCVCDEYKWDCDHLIDDRLAGPRIAAFEGSKLEAFAYDGQRQILEMEFRVGAPHTPGDEIPLPPPARFIHYFNVPRYVFTRLMRSRTASGQERYWYHVIQRRYTCQTVRTVCRLPRIRRFTEARLTRYMFDDYLLRLSPEEQQTLTLAVTVMRRCYCEPSHRSSLPDWAG